MEQLRNIKQGANSPQQPWKLARKGTVCCHKLANGLLFLQCSPTPLVVSRQLRCVVLRTALLGNSTHWLLQRHTQIWSQLVDAKAQQRHTGHPRFRGVSLEPSETKIQWITLEVCKVVLFFCPMPPRGSYRNAN